jgi:hypothetical protein
MESLESKIDRLSPEQRKETEDFVDFLLTRSGPVPIYPGPSRIPDPARNVAPPPLAMIEPVHTLESQPSRRQNTEHQTDSGQLAEEPAAPPVLQEISGGPADIISRDYMDYGQFERPQSQPSPATEAVRKVKTKLAKSDERDRSKHLLDWID